MAWVASLEEVKKGRTRNVADYAKKAPVEALTASLSRLLAQSIKLTTAAIILFQRPWFCSIFSCPWRRIMSSCWFCILVSLGSCNGNPLMGSTCWLRVSSPYTWKAVFTVRNVFLWQPFDPNALRSSLDRSSIYSFTSFSNEAIFQRTIMMNLIARHCLIYRRDTSRPRLLEISVEEFWTCPPALSRAFVESEGRLLTKPKPDLAISFYRDRLLPDLSWISLPTATQSLASYENLRLPAWGKVFHFLTIEAKKGMTSTTDSAALLQNLNNASQSLYNIYEFFREAGSNHEQDFFEKVRFFPS